MNVYIDSSVLLRVVFGQKDRWAGWSRVQRAISSELIRVECLRTIDRYGLRSEIETRELADRRAAVLETLEGFDLIRLDPLVLARAAEAFPTPLGTLDALHLASAIAARSEIDQLSLATHDTELGIAARAVGFIVQGLPG